MDENIQIYELLLFWRETKRVSHQTNMFLNGRMNSCRTVWTLRLEDLPPAFCERLTCSRRTWTHLNTPACPNLWAPSLIDCSRLLGVFSDSSAAQTAAQLRLWWLPHRLQLKSSSWQTSFTLSFRSMIQLIIYGWSWISGCWLDSPPHPPCLIPSFVSSSPLVPPFFFFSFF